MKKEYVLKQIKRAENKIEDVKADSVLLGDVRKKAKEKILFLFC